MPVVDASGTPIHYELAGSGPPLVLLHGFVGDSTTWRHAGYVDALAGRFRVVLVDGRGRSGKPHDPAMYGTHHLAADVLAVLDELGVDRAGVWGQSLGGRVGLVLAVRHPGRLRALVVGATRAQAVTADAATIEAEVRSIREHGMAGVVADLEAAGPLPEWLRSVILAADPGAVAAGYAAMLDWRGVLEELGGVRVPTLILAGDRDPRLRRPARDRRADPGRPLCGAARLRPPGDVHPQRPRPPDRAAVPHRDTDRDARLASRLLWPLGGVVRTRRVVRFAHLIDRRGRDLGGPSARRLRRQSQFGLDATQSGAVWTRP